MATWKNNMHSFWLRGAVFDAWLEQNNMTATEGPAEFVWVDLETTGLSVERDVPLELGIMLTDHVGNVCRDGVADWKIWAADPYHGKSWPVAQASMDDLVKEMHNASGLTTDLAVALRGGSADHMEPAWVAYEARLFLDERVSPNAELQLSGSSPHFDRGFIARDLPVLNDWFHYRSGVDVSSLREVAKRVNPAVVEGQPTARKKHRPVPDLMDSVTLYRYLLRNFIRMDNKTREYM